MRNCSSGAGSDGSMNPIRSSAAKAIGPKFQQEVEQAGASTSAPTPGRSPPFALQMRRPSNRLPGVHPHSASQPPKYNIKSKAPISS